jgi:hypothetical protein
VIRIFVGICALLTGVAGCASTGDRACARLAPDTARDASCPDGILEEDLPGPGEVVSTEVYGQWAQVRTTTDTVFLAVFPGGWRVVAAGCTSRGNQPYECALQGG